MEIPRPPFFRNRIPRAPENEAPVAPAEKPSANEENPSISAHDSHLQESESAAEQTQNASHADIQNVISQEADEANSASAHANIGETVRMAGPSVEQTPRPLQQQNESIPQKPSPANTRSRHLSSAEAAEELGVTRHQIAMLARNDEINATMVSGVLLIDPFSLRQYKQLKRGNGRPISADVAWAMLWTLSGLDAPWLDYQQRRRAILKLREIDAPDLVWQTRKRSKRRVFYTSTNLFGEIGTQLTLSGKSTDRPDIFGMPKNTHELEGYADEDTLNNLIEKYDLHEDISGNLLVHCAVSTPWQDDMDLKSRAQMPVAAVACDLAASLDPRESRAGISALEILLGGFRRLSV